MTEAYIYDAVRTPRGKGKADGGLHEVTALRTAATVLEEIRDRNDIDTAALEDVILGCVTPVGEQGGEIARTAVLYANYDERVPGLHINRFCASGLEAVNLAANQVKAGAGASYVAGGVEMMSRVPMGSDGFAIGSTRTLRSKPTLCRRAYPPTSSPRSTASAATMSTLTRSRASAGRPSPGKRGASTNPSCRCGIRTALR